MTFVADIAVVALVVFAIVIIYKIVAPWIPFSAEWARRMRKDYGLPEKPEKKKKEGE